jgi:cell pole-organizing protein PopZ
MAPADVSLLLRSGYKQDAIIAEVQKKRLSAPLDGATEDALLRAGASPALIAAMKAEKNLLTPTQQQAFADFAAEKTQRVRQEASSQQQAAVAAQQAENEERQRRASTLQQTLQNARVAENKEKAREQAWDTYKRQKEYLEKRIVSLQNNINQRRSYGSRENNLVEANQELDRLNEQLRHLPTPELR